MNFNVYSQFLLTWQCCPLKVPLHMFKLLWQPRIWVVSEYSSKKIQDGQRKVAVINFRSCGRVFVSSQIFFLIPPFWYHAGAKKCFYVTLSNVWKLANACWILFRTTLQWSSPPAKHITIFTAMSTKKITDFGHMNTQKNRTRSLCIGKKILFVVLSQSLKLSAIISLKMSVE